MQFWRAHAGTLNRLGLLESLDQVSFALLCDCYAGYLRIRNELSHEQLVLYAGESNYPTPNPLCALMKAQSKALRDLLADFGMTPGARTSLTGSTTVTPADHGAVDPLEALLLEMSSGDPPPPVATKPARKPAKKRAAKRQPKAR